MHHTFSMGLSKISLKLINTILPFRDFLYILQLEEYHPGRYIQWLPKFFFRRNIEKRERLVFTGRALITLIFSIILTLGFFFILSLFSHSPFALLAFAVASLLLIPLFVLATNTLVAPLVYVASEKEILKAAQKVRSLPNLKVIAIAGSHGKTTTRALLYQLTKLQLNTQTLPGNINTPLGIARWVQKELKPETELLIAEVDGYWQGEIARSLTLLQPDMSILVSIGTQHLARFPNDEALRTSLLEVFTHTKDDAVCIYPASLSSVVEPHIGERKKHPVTTTNTNTPTDFSEAQQHDYALAVVAAKLLGVNERTIAAATTRLELPERRQHVTSMRGYDVLDDSYNISFETALSGIEAARRYADQNKKRLLIVTAGIPEAGEKSAEMNQKLGELLESHANHIVILGSDFQNSVRLGIESGDITEVKDLKTFWSIAEKKFPPSKWFILLQPELTDLYY